MSLVNIYEMCRVCEKYNSYHEVTVTTTPIYAHKTEPTPPRQDPPSPTQSAGNSPIQLSSDARALQTAEASLRALPEVNAERVAEIKAALSSGQYQVDELVVADKLLAMEELLD